MAITRRRCWASWLVGKWLTSHCPLAKSMLGRVIGGLDPSMDSSPQGGDGVGVSGDAEGGTTVEVTLCTFSGQLLRKRSLPSSSTVAEVQAAAREILHVRPLHEYEFVGRDVLLLLDHVQTMHSEQMNTTLGECVVAAGGGGEEDKDDNDDHGKKVTFAVGIMRRVGRRVLFDGRLGKAAYMFDGDDWFL